MKTKQKSEDQLNDEALSLLLSAKADEFTRALDRHGWMIVCKPEIAALHAAEGAPPLGPWPMNGPGECPDWAMPWDRPPVKSAAVIPFPKR
jgi:hypothetical protein